MRVLRVPRRALETLWPLCPVQVRRRRAASRGPSALRSAPAWTPWSAAATSTSRPCPGASPRTSPSCECRVEGLPSSSTTLLQGFWGQGAPLSCLGARGPCQALPQHGAEPLCSLRAPRAGVQGAAVTAQGPQQPAPCTGCAHAYACHPLTPLLRLTPPSSPHILLSRTCLASACGRPRWRRVCKGSTCLPHTHCRGAAPGDPRVGPVGVQMRVRPGSPAAGGVLRSLWVQGGR